MTAQYKPYKDQEDFDADQIDDNWDDNDRGRVEIFDKSHKPASKRKLVIGILAIAVISILLGFVVGYFGHTRHSECKHRWSVALHSVMGANPKIREKILDNVVPAEIENMIRHATKTSRVAGLPESIDFTLFLKDKWENYGLKVKIASYKATMSYSNPRLSNSVQIVDADDKLVYSAISVNLRGDQIKHVRELNPIAAYSKSGTVVGKPVFGGDCLPLTLKREQEAFSLDFNGTILICQQGSDNMIEEAVRGAEKVGAVGVLFYIDPKDLRFSAKQGVFKNDAVGMINARYTKGLYGDPSSYGFPATSSANRLKLKYSHLPNILVQPISSEDAYNILNKISGFPVTSDKNGGFNFTYNVGPGFKSQDWKLKMVINNVLKSGNVDNVIGTIRGYVEPDRYVIIGAHRDSWRYGAINNAGGTAVLSELARLFGCLVRDGWKPRRTIIFASWDANCYGRIGSTEWVEENLKILKDRVVAYLNIDSVVTGNEALVGSGSSLLMNAVFNATREVKSPKNGGEASVYQEWLHYDNVNREVDRMLFKLYAEKGAGTLAGFLKSATDPYIPRYSPINTLSDWQPFVDKAGVPVVSFQYVEKSINYSIHKYDTQYDTFENLKKIDPGFILHTTVAKVYAELLRNIADSLFIPFNLFEFVQEIDDKFFNKLKSKRKVWKKNGIDFAILETAMKNFTNAALFFHVKQELSVLSNPMEIRMMNDQLHLLEKMFTEVNHFPMEIMERAFNDVTKNKTHEYYISHNGILMDVAAPGLSGLLSTLSNFSEKGNWEAFKLYYSVVVSTILAASKSLSEIP